MGIQRLAPVSGGTDFTKYTPKIQATNYSVQPSNVTTHLSITGKGMLTGVQIISSASYYVDIVLDGVSLGTNGATYGSGEWFILPGEYKFNSSLVIRTGNNDSGSSRAHKVLVGYLLE